MGERGSGAAAGCWRSGRRVSAADGVGDLGDVRAHLVASVLAPGRGPHDAALPRMQWPVRRRASTRCCYHHHGQLVLVFLHLELPLTHN
uniref:Uncharacterized protein n=1 Tax=Oryza glaberrima TaxID=4538 RepID=I1NY25_ORYGL